MRKTQPGQKQITTMKPISSENQDADFKLERYKYILEEIRSLNENIHKYLTLFQTLAVAIISGGIGIFVVRKNLQIDVKTTEVAIQGALDLLILLDLFITISIMANILSWLDYRKEEVEFLGKEIGHNFRKPPTLRNFWRWSETYILLFMNLAVLAVYLYTEYQMIPLVK